MQAIKPGDGGRHRFAASSNSIEMLSTKKCETEPGLTQRVLFNRDDSPSL